MPQFVPQRCEIGNEYYHVILSCIIQLLLLYKLKSTIFTDFTNSHWRLGSVTCAILLDHIFSSQICGTATHCKTCSWNLTSLQNIQTQGSRSSQTCFHWISPPMLIWGFLKHWKRASYRVTWIFTASRCDKAWQNTDIILASISMYIKGTDSRSKTEASHEHTTNYAVLVPPSLKITAGNAFCGKRDGPPWKRVPMN